jgi:drug/metabolite transporter (DMT)-like permease
MHHTHKKSQHFTYLKLHVIVIILGFSAIFGKLIQLDATELVFFRTFTACIFLIGFALLKNLKSVVFQWKAIQRSILVGILLAAHWITFFHAIKVSNVSVTLACLGTSTLFAAFFEPYTDKKKVRLVDILAGVFILAGMYTIFRFEFRYAEGIIFSVISALLAAIFNVFNKHLSYKHDFRALAFGELTTACIVTFLFMIVTGYSPLNTAFNISMSDLTFLLLLGSIGTAYAFTATISVINRLNAYAVLLAINLEPVYGILLARWIFGESEMMTGGFYAGAAFILLTVILYSIYSYRSTQIQDAEKKFNDNLHPK